MGYMIKNDIPYAGSPSNFTLNEASAYNPSTEYVVGDYCIYQNTLRKCTGATSGAFDSSKWERTTIAGELRRLCFSYKRQDINANSLTQFGTYTIFGGDGKNLPNTNQQFWVVDVKPIDNNSLYTIQVAYNQAQPNKIFVRKQEGGTWSGWYAFTGTLV